MPALIRSGFVHEPFWPTQFPPPAGIEGPVPAGLLPHVMHCRWRLLGVEASPLQPEGLSKK